MLNILLQGCACRWWFGLGAQLFCGFSTSTHAPPSVERASKHTSQMQSYASGPAHGMTRRVIRSTSKASCQPYQAIRQATEGYQNRHAQALGVHRREEFAALLAMDHVAQLQTL
jgi:hypothetical protein